jgi:hypothetical protein
MGVWVEGRHTNTPYLRAVHGDPARRRDSMVASTYHNMFVIAAAVVSTLTDFVVVVEIYGTDFEIGSNTSHHHHHAQKRRRSTLDTPR